MSTPDEGHESALAGKIGQLSTEVATFSQDMQRWLSTLSSQAASVEDRLAALEAQHTTLHGIVRVVQRETQATRGRLEVLLDSFAALRSEYLRDHPRPEAG